MPVNRGEKLSPQSIGSDDAGIMAAVAAQMQSSWEKKRQEKEAKFMHNAKAEIDKCSMMPLAHSYDKLTVNKISSRLEEYSMAITNLNTVYEKFVFEYAQVDDRIRKLWLDLQQEQQYLLMLSEKKNKAMLDQDREREKGQVKGMAMAKKAVGDFGKLISSLEER